AHLFYSGCLSLLFGFLISSSVHQPAKVIPTHLYLRLVAPRELTLARSLRTHHRDQRAGSFICVGRNLLLVGMSREACGHQCLLPLLGTCVRAWSQTEIAFE